MRFTVNAFGQRVLLMPRLRFNQTTDNGAGGGGGDNNQQQQENKSGDQQQNNAADRGYPANTPVKDMTPEQQIAYHSYHARKHEDRVKQFGDRTPEQIRQMESELAELRTKSLSAEEQQIEKAKEEGRAEVRSILAIERVTNSLERALTGRIPDASALLALDRSKFVDGDKANDAAIKEWVEANSTEGTTGRKTVDLGQGKRGNATAEKGVDAGRSLFESTRSKKTTQSTQQ